jgi:outer membrane protein
MTRKALALCGLAVVVLLNQVGCVMPESQALRAKINPDEAREVSNPPAAEMDESRTAEKGPTLGDDKPADVAVEPETPSTQQDQAEQLPAPQDSRSQRSQGHGTSAHAKNNPVKQETVQHAGFHQIVTNGHQVVGAELTLEEAISMTFHANPDLQSAQERTRIAEEVLANARAQFFPILASNAAYQASDNPLRKFSFLLSQGVADPNTLFPLRSNEDLFHGQLHFQQDLYTGGLRLAQTRAAAAERDAAEFSLAAVHNKLVFQVAEAYYRVFQARALVGVRREAVAQVESQLKAVRSRFAANTVVKSDVLKVEVRLAEVREGLSTAVNALELSRAVLENVMGTRLEGRQLPDTLPPAPWCEHVTQAEGAVEAVTEMSEVEGVVAEAIENRPEMSEAANRIRAAEQKIRAAKSGKYPTVGVVTDYDLNNGSRETNNSYFVGLAFSLNLFDGGRTRSSVRQAEAQAREIAAHQQRLALDVELDVRRAYLSLKDARERLKLTGTALTSAAENLRLVESRFREQTATTTELLDAQVLLSDVRVRSTSAAADVEIARASLERAVGRLTTLLSSFDSPHS